MQSDETAASGKATVRLHAGRRLLGAGALLAIAVGAALFTDAVRVLGRNIPQSRIELDYLTGVIVAVTVAVTIPFWPVSEADKRPLLIVWAAKCVVTLGFMLAYEWSYGLDAYLYFEASASSAPVAPPAFGQGTTNMQFMSWALAQFLSPSYHALKVFLSLVGLLGIYAVYRGATNFANMRRPQLLYFLALFPSSLFWSSILGKDPVQLLGNGLYFYGVLSWVHNRKGSYLLVAMIGLAIAMFMRLWTGVILIVPLGIFALFQVRGVTKRIGFAVVLLAALSAALYGLADQFRLESAQDIAEMTQKLTEGAGWEAGSSIRPARITTVADFISYAPTGMFAALFRPLPGELGGVFGLMASLENGFLFVATLVSLLRLRFREPIVWWAIAVILGWSLVYGTAVFNLGTVVRFKLQILPLMLLLFAYALWRPRQVGEPGRTVA